MEGISDVVSTSLPFAINLGQHILEVLEEQAILLVDPGQGTEAVRLDRDETYKLLLILRELFK